MTNDRSIAIAVALLGFFVFVVGLEEYELRMMVPPMPEEMICALHRNCPVVKAPLPRAPLYAPRMSDIKPLTDER